MHRRVFVLVVDVNYWIAARSLTDPSWPVLLFSRKVPPTRRERDFRFDADFYPRVEARFLPMGRGLRRERLWTTGWHMWKTAHPFHIGQRMARHLLLVADCRVLFRPPPLLPLPSSFCYQSRGTRDRCYVRKTVFVVDLGFPRGPEVVVRCLRLDAFPMWNGEKFEVHTAICYFLIWRPNEVIRCEKDYRTSVKN